MEVKYRRNRMKQKILSGQDHSWLLLDLMSIELIEIIGMLGYDYFMIEGEHAFLNEQHILDMVRAAERYDMTACIRLQPPLDPGQIGRLLDIGIQGLHYTHVRSAADVKAFVSAAKYPPIGDRGFGRFSRMNGFGLGDEQEAMKAGNEEIFLSIAIEDIEGAENIEEICAAPGLDQIGIGPSDLSASMGIPGQYSNPKFQGGLSARPSGDQSLAVRSPRRPSPRRLGQYADRPVHAGSAGRHTHHERLRRAQRQAAAKRIGGCGAQTLAGVARARIWAR